ncbi:SCO family protein [Sulfitobacter mediterraneus]|uniref:Protein senC n=1 Tax=Sulfitobacter mediterraneus TaxID=83219 RepID=A0A061SQE7_9RHOB|nr:SCO family protein [Sulfitobacter mediterraneus]KAJ03931.1 protein senC [Sulfitobacter mediterraneus]MBM1308644.1 SCO family protein [Sulfitobacter mediterraneus]MBM1312529.1 SCO family protein [Sulfitobacter mediterraneus]MBM1320910.1 SCO family protein [Sulfitobacter mediterraneus]MBM1324798.1 SCO family protein [Sulfitobacter mediterraneus]
MNRTIAITAAAAAAALLLGTYLVTSGSKSDDKFAQCRSAAVAGELGGPFELVNGQGQTVTDKEVITQPTLIYFGYTYCPDVCPLDVDRNASAIEILEERGTLVTPVFISIDPARDTPEVVGEFAEVMHPRMIGLTGSEAQVKAASTAYRTYYKAHEAVDDEYLVDHSTFSYLVMPEEGFVEYFRRETTPEQMADKIGCFVDQL